MGPEIDHALEVSEASILVAHVERTADLATSKLAEKLPLGVVWYGAGNSPGRKLEDLMATASRDIDLTPLTPGDPAQIFFTSGSTGWPKGVTHTAETFGWMIESFATTVEITAQAMLPPASSLSHIFAFLVGLSGLSRGAPVVITRNLEGGEILPLLRDHRPTIFSMLPSALLLLVRDHGASRDDFRSLRVMFAGGDKVAEELEHEFTELTGSAIDELYGMSEFGPSHINPLNGPNRLGSVGTTAAGFQSQVRDDEGNELPTGEAGRLWIRSPSNMVSYWNHPESTAATIVEGWLDTGDIMVLDSEGYLWFQRRKKQIIVHDGSTICPQEVESALLAHPALQEAGMVGFHHLIHGENVRAYVTLREGVMPPSSQELIRFARERLGYKASEEIVFLPQMPLNATGKVDRVGLKRIAEEEHASTTGTHDR